MSTVETKWPSGPWHYQEESDAYTHIVRGPSGEYIGAAPQGTNGEAEAAARLWAAAPDLFCALAYFVNPPDEFDTETAFQLSRAALIKALPELEKHFNPAPESEHPHGN